MIVLLSKGGGLGNRVWTYAHVLAFGLEHNVSVWGLSLDEFAASFPGLAMDLFARGSGKASFPAPSVRRRRLLYHGVHLITAGIARLPAALQSYRIVRLDWHEWLDLDDGDFVKALSGSRITVLQGFLFIAADSLERNGDRVRSVLRLPAAVENQANDILQHLQRDHEVVIGVHVRRGDYATFMSGAFYYEIPTYADIMYRAAGLFPDKRVAFIVSSDERQSTARFHSPLYSVDLAPGTPLADLCVLSRCDYLIGPPSTFSLWAAFYGKRPICVVEDPSASFRIEDFHIPVSHFRPRKGMVQKKVSLS